MRPILLGLFLFTAQAAAAQSGSVRTEVDVRKIGTDDVATLSIVLDGDAASLDAALPLVPCYFHPHHRQS